MKEFFKNYSAYLAWAVTLISVAGSFYFSNVLGFQPCILCWYQRIAMDPLVIIIGLGILLKDKNFILYALPFSAIGFGIAVYHNLLYYGVIPESIAPCINGVSCVTKYINYFGFISIPFLSMCAFLLITILLLIYR